MARTSSLEKPIWWAFWAWVRLFLVVVILEFLTLESVGSSYRSAINADVASVNLSETHSILKKDIRWTVQSTHNVDTVGHALVVFQIKEILDDTRGWSRAGITFHPASQDLEYDFVFVILTEDAFNGTCGRGRKGRSGCMNLAGPGQSPSFCKILLTEKLFSYEAKVWLRTGTIHHEVGHCIGLGHSANPYQLMYSEWMYNIHPTPVEVGAVKQRLGKTE